MKRQNSSPQILILEPGKILVDLTAMGFSPEISEQFARQVDSLVFRLRNVPRGLIPVLKNVPALENNNVLFGKTDDGKQIFEAVIAGTENELNDLCKQLENCGEEPAKLAALLHDTLVRSSRKNSLPFYLGHHRLPLGQRTLIMGILNVTPDSFSDGGRFDQLDKALTQAFRMAEEGADIIDIGGESTRPGHLKVNAATGISRVMPVDAEVELNRVMPVIKALKKDQTFKLPLSIDTYKAQVAQQALAAGVEMLNDVWGLKADPQLGTVAAHFDVPICLMHNRNSTDYEDLIADIIAEMKESIALAQNAGIKDEKMIIDPGIGFGKDLQQNLDVMLHLNTFCRLGYPLLLGTSRKSMIGKTLDLPTDERMEGTAATVAYGIVAGADIVRVHDVLSMKRVAVMTDTIIRR
ncbi:MAG: dihydropteroate synthase [Bacillota bacterium]|nr:dihydropteroate synthase [Bacillota bacterium]